MNIVIVYYSYSGNTHQAAQIIEGLLSQDHLVKRLRVEALDESDNFFIQAWRGLVRKKAKIAPIETDLSAYDLIILGTPVWAREMVPAMRTYLVEAAGLSGKKAIVFVTYGSGLGKEHCLSSLERALQAKGISQINRFSLSQFKVGDRTLIESLVNRALHYISNSQ